MQNDDKKVSAVRGWLARLVRALVRLSVIVALVGVHHTWFSVGSRAGWLSLLDGLVILALSYAVIRVSFGKFKLIYSNAEIAHSEQNN